MESWSDSMPSRFILVLALLFGLGSGLPLTVQAALFDRGPFDTDGIPGGPTVRLVYDDDLNITWLGDANFAQTSGFDADGQMPWQSAVDWADSLTVGGFTDWRLPTTMQPDSSCSINNGSISGGSDCTGSEMGHLYHIEGVTNIAPGLFGNLSSTLPYWSGTKRADAPCCAWNFSFRRDSQSGSDKLNNYFAWAVRDGEVGTVNNRAPQVSAGSDQNINLPGIATLDGTATDDGLPLSPGVLSTTWSKISGAGTINFGNLNAIDTTAAFSLPGTYLLRLTATDGVFTNRSDVTIIVNSEIPPTVEAGRNQRIILPSGAVLNGTVTDDGLPNPPGMVSILWSKVSGPGTVRFDDADTVDTTASFSLPGTYVLRLTANDGALTTSDEVTVIVAPPWLEAKTIAFFTQGNTLHGDPVLCHKVENGDFFCRILEPLNDGFREADSQDVALGFVNGDQHLDAVFARAESYESQNRVCLGDGSGGFTCSYIGPEGGQSYGDSNNNITLGVALGFVDGDRHLDAIFANSPGNSGVGASAKNRLCLGDGSGEFTCQDVSPDTNSSTGVALGLVDDDQHLDAVFTNWNEPNRVCLGNGSGGFTCQDVSADTNSSTGVALGLVDDDQHLDAIFANRNQSNRICLGDGSGGFTCQDVSTDANNTGDVALGFMNGDQHIDAVFANNNQPNRICLGDGKGGFTCKNISSESKNTGDVALGFVDGDHHLDAIFANTNEPNRVCLGDGTGEFTCQDIIHSDHMNASQGVALAGPIKQPPTVKAGNSQTITLPNAAMLDGTVTDDGWPNPPGRVITTWGKVSGPGTVTFGNAHAVDTTATFTLPGMYVLRLTANDGALMNSAEVTITVKPMPPPPMPPPIINQPPSVNAGPAQTVILPNSATLDGTVNDDGRPNPPGVVTTTWSKVSGPGVVAIGNPTAVDTTASFFSAGTYVLRLTATDGALSTSADVTITVNNQGVRRERSDVNGDGKADIVWRNSNGATAIWFMNGTAIASAGFPGGVPLAWQIAGVGDVNGDGKADVIWRHSTSGTVAIWLMNGVTITSVGFPGSAPPAWGIQALGDVNGDGKADIVWRNTSSGAVSVWFMNGATITSAGFPPGVSLAWQMAGVGDVNGDGNADVIWRKGSSGTVAIWLMNGLTITSVGFPGTTPVAWKIEGVGDTNDDGKADLIWKHDTSGLVVIWLMNGATRASSGVVGGLASSWKIAQVGDVDGNGTADLVWRHSLLGAVEVWIMNGVTLTTTGSAGGVSTDWEIQ